MTVKGTRECGYHWSKVVESTIRNPCCGVDILRVSCVYSVVWDLKTSPACKGVGWGVESKISGQCGGN